MKTLRLKERETVKLPWLEELFDEPREKTVTAVVHVPRTEEPCLPVFQTEPDRALGILKKHGYESKVFCLAKDGDNTSEFEVKSSNGNWHVSPVRNTEQIPTRFREGVRLLWQNKVKFDAIAIATPVPVEAPHEVIRDEFLFTLRALSNAALTALAVMLKATVALAPLVLAPLSLVLPPDPVLLVRIEDKWVEIGRWI